VPRVRGPPVRDVLVVGAGPVGLLLATLLVQEGADVVVWEKRRAAAAHSRAIGVHAPALDVLDRAGARDAVVDQAVLVRGGAAFSGGRRLGVLSFDAVSERNPFVAALPQHETERVLVARLAGLDERALARGVTLSALRQDRDGVEAVGTSVTERGCEVRERARFVVGADGARSVVRTLLGIPTVRREYRDTYVMGDFGDLTSAGSQAQVFLEPPGVVESFPLPRGRRRFVVRTSRRVLAPTAEQLAEVVRRRTRQPLAAEDCSMVSAFGVRRRLARRLVDRRVVLVGDAAHEVSPIGGQGMNLGWLDAAALAPLLLRGSSDGVLDRLALEGWERARLASARRAARISEANMVLGRPASGVRRALRDAALRGVLGTGLSRQLAALYAMRGA